MPVMLARKSLNNDLRIISPMGKKMDDADVKKECPSCGLGVALDARICEFCGWDFNEEDEWILQIEKLERDLVVEKQKFEPGSVRDKIEASLRSPALVKKEQLKASAAKAKLQKDMAEVLGDREEVKPTPTPEPRAAPAVTQARETPTPAPAPSPSVVHAQPKQSPQARPIIRGARPAEVPVVRVDEPSPEPELEELTVTPVASSKAPPSSKVRRVRKVKGPH